MPPLEALKRDLESLHPLDTAQQQRLAAAVRDLTASQLNWASGYLAGLGARLDGAQMASDKPGVVGDERPTLTILYASQTGNAQSVAEQLADEAARRGVDARLVSAAAFKPKDLANERLLLLVVSTQGEGEPPESALELAKFLHGRRAPDLSGLRFGVFGLGDSSYELFCEAARQFDRRLAELGAERIVDRVDADVDFENVSAGWIQQALNVVEQQALAGTHGVVVPISGEKPVARYGRNNPYQATLIENRALTTTQAHADVRHLVLEIDPDALHYRPGDSLGIWCRNDPQLVAQIVAALDLDAAAEVSLATSSLCVERALCEKLEITLLNPAVVGDWLALSANSALCELVADKAALRNFAVDHQLIDLVTDYPPTAPITAQQLVDLLKPLQPRLYSIASSQREYPDEIHLTVSALRYDAHGRSHQGAASGFLTSRLGEDDTLGVYLVENAAFRLPQDGDTPVIMIGAGTGVAPFRSFLQERAAREDGGRNWLIFGNRRFHHDFLYQSEWLALREAGVLDKISVAFSRDSERRCYVQDRVLEQGAEIYAWLQDGASLYVCGGIAMEAGVLASLRDLLAHHAGLSEDAASVYIEQLREDGRYQRDVY